MSEKKSGPGKGRAFRPDAPAAPPPPKELVDRLLNEEVGDSDGTYGLVQHNACV